jgi:alpha-ketoglutarate-dependent taurine dioxygenase
MSPYLNQPDSASPLAIKPVSGRIGAIISGVKLGGDLDDATIAAIRAALVRHKVIFFRDQTHLNNDGQEAFASLLGEPIGHPTVPVVANTSTLMELDSDHGGYANAWHTDITFVPAYPSASILRAVVIPEAGGDTVWANTETAYDDLSPELKAIAGALRAVHTNRYDYATEGDLRASEAKRQELEDYQKVFSARLFEAEHSVVCLHPDSGKPSLVLGQFFKSFTGFNAADSQKLFEILQGHITRLENTARWSWGLGDVAIWDNRATQHYAIADYSEQKRVMRRVTLKGDIAVGIDGTRSRALKGIVHEAAETVAA